MPDVPLKSLEQAWDLGFCDGLSCLDAVMAENERLRAERTAGCSFCPAKRDLGKRVFFWQLASCVSGVFAVLVALIAMSVAIDR